MFIGAYRTLRSFALLSEPPVAFFALRGLSAQHTDLFGYLAADGGRGYQQVLHKPTGLPWSDAGELLKQSRQPVDRGHDSHLSIVGDKLDKVLFLTYYCNSCNRTGRQPCKNSTVFLS